MKKPILRVTITLENKEEHEKLIKLAQEKGWSLSQLFRRKALGL